ncbi:hypothetical protein IT774_04245 [Salinimonas marina]|uniref:Capsular polysaccharide synthesis protein n=1 Tax=Salinimonas marina TaxID=2785918 RepID=A0A7S9HDQ3_9ALTE|nr:capsular polysaccharide synthesis protein [Salinimonas marina]QPG06409.1 hypothetical protein IT774_04245 [Salinimonas marina]
MIDPEGIPRTTPIEKWRHRRFVGQQHRRDKANQRKLGLDTFSDDWSQLRSDSTTGWPPRRLWILWLQSESQAPPLVTRCINSWRDLNPGWQVEVLDERSLSRWIELPKFPPGTSLNHMANIIRLRLLVRYGGIWTDATTLCLRPLDDWIGCAYASGMFAFARPQPVRSLANWFIASAPEATLTKAWQRWSESYVLSGKRPQSYFWSHHTFDWLLQRSPYLHGLWSQTPQVSARGPHVFQRLLDGHLDGAELPDMAELAQVPLAKLNHKKGYTVEAVDGLLNKYGLIPNG